MTTKGKTWKLDEEQLELLRKKRSSDNEARLLARRHARREGIDPLSLEATSPLTVAWLKSS